MTPNRRNAIKGKHKSELTREQRADACECWLRDNVEHFPHGMPQHLTFLLDRLDQRDMRIELIEAALPRLLTFVLARLDEKDARIAQLEDLLSTGAPAERVARS